MPGLLDTDILSDYLGRAGASTEGLARREDASVSAITWMELMVVAAEREEAAGPRSSLNEFRLVPIDEGVSEKAVIIRRDRRIRLPDAVIWASARHIGGLLVTRNTKDFAADELGVRVPHSI